MVLCMCACAGGITHCEAPHWTGCDWHIDTLTSLRSACYSYMPLPVQGFFAYITHRIRYTLTSSAAAVAVLLRQAGAWRAGL